MHEKGADREGGLEQDWRQFVDRESWRLFLPC